MPRLMSVAFTEQQVRDRTKTVTRRNGWKFIEPGDRLTLCRKVMGRKPGEPLDRIVDVEVVAASREPLSAITADEVAREGFPGMEPTEFVRRFFVDAQGLSPDAEVTRIQWRYLDEAPSALVKLRRGLTLNMIRSLVWWSIDGAVHCDVDASTKAALVRRGLARWAEGDDLCPRLTDLGVEMRDLLRAETPDPTSERAST